MHFSIAYLQRGAKLQPVGRSMRSGGTPSMGTSLVPLGASRRVCQKRPPVPQGMVGALSWCEGEVLILQRRHGGPSCGGQISGAALTDRLVPTPVALR